MEFLKELFGDQALSYDQLEKAVKEKGMNIVDGANQVAREKFEAIRTERDSLKSQLSEASSQIESLKGMDIEGVQRAAEEWKTKYEMDTQELRDQIAAKEYEFSVKEAVSGIKFTSASAQKAFMQDLLNQKLPTQEGKVLGLEDFVKRYQETDPEAFAQEGAAPKLVLGGSNTPLQTVTKAEYAKMGYSERFKFKSENPERYQELNASK